MDKKFIVLIVVILAMILALFSLYILDDAFDSNSESVELEVYSGFPIKLTDIIRDVETGSYYEDYNNDTLNWMKSLGDKYVFRGNGTFLVMDLNDAYRLPHEDVTDVIIINHIKCNVLEKHSLGNVKYPKEVILVDNVEFLNQEIIDLGFA